MTNDAYIMRNSSGQKAEFKKEDLEGVTCLIDEKKKLMEKAKKKDGQLMRYLKAEIEHEKKIKMFKQRQKENEKNLKKFNNLKNKQLKLIENDRYKDNQNIYERQKLIQKLQNELDLNSKNINNLNNLNINPALSASLPNAKTSPNTDNNNNNNNNNQLTTRKLPKEKSESKLDTLKKQIKDYEKKNEEFKQKIVNMFELKDKEEIKDIIKKNKIPEDNSQKMKSTDFIKKKLNKMENKFEK